MTTTIFGDSFIGSFTLIDDDNINIYQFKGATMKGITKKNNKNRKMITTVINNSNNDCIIFNFGQVDLYFSYYYTKFVKNEKFMMKSIIQKYVEFINSLDCSNCNKIILAVYPTTIKDEYVFDTLLEYGILSDNDVKSISKLDKKKTSSFRFRYNMYIKFNNLLKEYCKLYKINFINLDNLLLNQDQILKSRFLDPVSKLNIHLLWEPLIPILLSKISKCKIKKKYKINLKKSMEKFIKLKKNEFTKKPAF